MSTCTRALTATPGRPARSRIDAIKMFLLATGASLLLSCAGTPPAPVVDSAPAPGPDRLFTMGDYAQAAQLWQQQALSTSGPEAGALRISAANAWLLAGDAARAQDNVRMVDKSELPTAEQARMNLVLADLALRANRPDEAKQLLQEAAPRLPKSERRRFNQLREQMANILAQPGATDISQSMALIQSSEIFQPEQALMLLQSLEAMPSGELVLRSGNPRSNQTAAAWLDLALLMRQNLVAADQLQPDIVDWKVRYPNFFMTEDDALSLWLRYRQQFAPPSRVAVLLPGSGRLQAAAEAIRDGIMNAYLDDPGGAEIFFLSTGEDGEMATSAYFEALDLGAKWIIGPLQKPSIEALLSLSELVTPVLALNDLPVGLIEPAGLAGQIYGISLSQEAEAQALAREVVRSALPRAIIMAPENEWGERMVLNFQDEFLQENGQIVASIRYQESENDYSSTLERVLKIDESKARKKQLENTLQMKLEFEPIRRDDVDVIFLAATTSQGRSIRPQLRFHDAGDIPVYSPSRIFTGKPDRTRDQDLNGVRFPITPLQLNADSKLALPGLSSLRGGAFASLYALGRDAWNLLPWLELMKRDPDFHFAGAAGFYRAEPNGKLLREPEMAIFEGGVPIPLIQSQASR